MAIVNRTPDSFYAPARSMEFGAALERVAVSISEGATIVDIGGVKAAPGSEISTREEAERVVEFVARIRNEYPDLVISVDTYRASVARLVCDVGADLLNDAWGGWDRELAVVAAEFNVGLVCTHAGGLPPRTRPHRVEYTDIAVEVESYLLGLVNNALDVGVSADQIIIDPGHDFAKNSRHSLAITRDLDSLVRTGWPVLVALSRKDFVGEALGLDIDERLEGGLAASAISAWHGARIFRTHDVRATKRVVDMISIIKGEKDLAYNRRGLA